MSSKVKSKISTFLAGAAVVKGQAVKLSSGSVIPGAAGTDRVIGLAQNDGPLAGDHVEVAMPGGGGFGLAGGVIAEGNLLGLDGSGHLVKVANASDIVIAQALEAAVAGDVFSVYVIGPFQATAAQA